MEILVVLKLQSMRKEVNNHERIQKISDASFDNMHNYRFAFGVYNEIQRRNY